MVSSTLPSWLLFEYIPDCQLPRVVKPVLKSQQNSVGLYLPSGQYVLTILV